MLEHIVSLAAQIAVVGLIVWAITSVVPMPDKFKQVIQVMAAVGVILFALRSFELI